MTIGNHQHSCRRHERHAIGKDAGRGPEAVDVESPVRCDDSDAACGASHGAGTKGAEEVRAPGKFPRID
jgi:hypothetical protein